jgi:two-component system chemotaxis response regulator CheY
MALNILVVDDSAVMRSMIVKTLHISGLPIGKIYEACHGQEGLDVISQNWIDLILTDINMPIMNGMEMVENLHANPETAHIPILFVSSAGFQANSEIVQKTGAGFIRKPFTPEQLRDTIIQLTGVSDDQSFTDNSSSSNGLDF